jgi:hypothetical protein
MLIHDKQVREKGRAAVAGHHARHFPAASVSARPVTATRPSQQRSFFMCAMHDPINDRLDVVRGFLRRYQWCALFGGRIHFMRFLRTAPATDIHHKHSKTPDFRGSDLSFRGSERGATLARSTTKAMALTDAQSVHKCTVSVRKPSSGRQTQRNRRKEEPAFSDMGSHHGVTR